MLRKFACLALAASALTGCIIVAKPAGTVEVYGHSEPHGHAYIYLPAYHAYYCTAHDDWWWIDGGRWTYVRTRPSHIHVDVNVAWVHVDGDDGPEPYRRFDDHSREYPQDWRSSRHAGPPPGRGWGPPADPGSGNRGQGNAQGRGADGDRDARHDDPKSRDAHGGTGKSRGEMEKEEKDRSEPADGDGDASGKGASPPKEKDKPKDKSRGKDKDKEKSKGKDPEQKSEKDKDVEKEPDPAEKKEQGEDDEEKKERGRKKRGD